MAIKAIVFDCFGVLIKSGHDLLRQDFPELVGLVDDLQGKSDMGNLSRELFNETVARATNLTAMEIEDRYWGTNKYNYLVIDWIMELRRSEKYKIGLLSNISRDWIKDNLKFFDSKKMFDEEVLSGDINIVKPDPRIFQLMADRIGLRPDECVMIDDVAANINGARQIGMHGIIYFSTDQSKDELNKLLELNNA